MCEEGKKNGDLFAGSWGTVLKKIGGYKKIILRYEEIYEKKL